MHKKILIILALIVIAANMDGQGKYMTRSGYIWFYSHTPVEDIKAHNRQAACILNTETGEIAVTLLMKSFEFKKALMQEHFNENYVESDKFPKASFQGKVQDASSVDFSSPGEYEVPVSGSLTIHGVTNEIETEVTLNIKADGPIKASTMFLVKPADYDIEIPKVVRENIAKEIEVHVDVALKKM